MSRSPSGTLDPVNDPECPECESALYTERKRGVGYTGKWHCHKCDGVFEPRR